MSPKKQKSKPRDISPEFQSSKAVRVVGLPIGSVYP